MATQKVHLFESRFSQVSTDFKASHLTTKSDFEIPATIPEGYLLVKIHAVGLNPVDYKVGSFGSVAFPLVPGLDVAGVVERVGDGVKDFKKGDRVYYHGSLKNKYGGFGQYGTIEAITACHLPDDVSFVDAAALPTAGWTAYVALYDKARIRSGETLVITAGSGGVGGFGIQLAKLVGATVITTCSGKNTEFVKKLGADYVIDYTKDDIKTKVMEITNNRGVDVWMDVIGSDSADLGLKCIAYAGSLIAIQGNPTTPLGELFTRTVSVHDVFLGGAHSADVKSRERFATIGYAMVKLVQDKKLNTLVGEVITFEQIPEALERIKDRHVTGKIVAKIVD